MSVASDDGPRVARRSIERCPPSLEWRVGLHDELDTGALDLDIDASPLLLEQHGRPAIAFAPATVHGPRSAGGSIVTRPARASISHSIEQFVRAHDVTVDALLDCRLAVEPLHSASCQGCNVQL